MAEPFTFETTYEPGAVQQEFFKSQRPSGMPTGNQSLLIAGLVGFALLLSWYTFALGAAILAASTFMFAMRNRTPNPALQRLEGGPIHLRISDTGLQLTARSYTTTAIWDAVRSASDMGDFMVFHTFFGRGIYLRARDLREAGVYEQVKAKVEERNAAYRQLLTPSSASLA